MCPRSSAIRSVVEGQTDLVESLHPTAVFAVELGEVQEKTQFLCASLFMLRPISRETRPRDFGCSSPARATLISDSQPPQRPNRPAQLPHSLQPPALPQPFPTRPPRPAMPIRPTPSKCANSSRIYAFSWELRKRGKSRMRSFTGRSCRISRISSWIDRIFLPVLPSPESTMRSRRVISRGSKWPS